jgi:hypothetical protein
MTRTICHHHRRNKTSDTLANLTEIRERVLIEVLDCRNGHWWCENERGRCRETQYRNNNLRNCTNVHTQHADPFKKTHRIKLFCMGFYFVVDFFFHSSKFIQFFFLRLYSTWRWKQLGSLIAGVGELRSAFVGRVFLTVQCVRNYTKFVWISWISDELLEFRVYCLNHSWITGITAELQELQLSFRNCKLNCGWIT